jgi:hypothetical protein
MIALTFGLGGEYPFYAEQAALRFTKFTGVPARPVTESEFRQFQNSPVMMAAPDLRHRSMLARMFLFEIVKEDDVIWFDVDYGCVAPWNPLEGYDGTFTAVRDRTGLILSHDDIRSSSIVNYFNSGFFMANRHQHWELLREIAETGHTMDNRWGDQCMLNRAIEEAGVPIRYLDRRHNCMNFGEFFRMSDVKAVHCSSNYTHYHAGTYPEPSAKFKWDQGKMRELAGFYNVEYDDEFDNVALFYDGTTSAGGLWAADSRGQIVFADIFGKNIRWPQRWRRVG